MTYMYITYTYSTVFDFDLVISCLMNRERLKSLTVRNEATFILGYLVTRMQHPHNA